jgi:hypothetical protein
MVMVEVGGDFAPCLPVPARSRGPPWARPMTTAPEPSLRGERLRPPNRSVMNSRLPKRMVLPRVKPSPEERLPPVTGTNADDGKYVANPLPDASTVGVFAPTRYRVVKILCSYPRWSYEL